MKGMRHHTAVHFERDLLPEERTIELPKPGVKIQP